MATSSVRTCRFGSARRVALSALIALAGGDLRVVPLFLRHSCSPAHRHLHVKFLHGEDEQTVMPATKSKSKASTRSEEPAKGNFFIRWALRAAWAVLAFTVLRWVDSIKVRLQSH